MRPSPLQGLAALRAIYEQLLPIQTARAPPQGFAALRAISEQLYLEQCSSSTQEEGVAVRPAAARAAADRLFAHALGASGSAALPPDLQQLALSVTARMCMWCHAGIGIHMF